MQSGIRIKSAVLVGESAQLVELRVVESTGLRPNPGRHHWVIVQGLTDLAAKELDVRVGSALSAIDCARPVDPVTIAVTPAVSRGSSLDLAVAAAVLAATGNERAREFCLISAERDGLVIGELALDGAVRTVRGVLPMALTARVAGIRGMVVPSAAEWEVAMVPELARFPIAHLDQILGPNLPASMEIRVPRPSASGRCDMSEVRGRADAVNALVGAIAEGRRILLAGPPGCGKTMIARRVPSVLPELTREESVEVTAIYSAHGLAQSPIIERPFRAPHHTISPAALVREARLATRGVLFLDELPEFSVLALGELVDALRRTDPARRPLILASAAVCPCGWWGSGARPCLCSRETIKRYEEHLAQSAAALAITARVSMPVLSLDELRDAEPGESSASIRLRMASGAGS